MLKILFHFTFSAIARTSILLLFHWFLDQKRYKLSVFLKILLVNVFSWVSLNILIHTVTTTHFFSIGYLIFKLRIFWSMLFQFLRDQLTLKNKHLEIICLYWGNFFYNKTLPQMQLKFFLLFVIYALVNRRIIRWRNMASLTWCVFNVSIWHFFYKMDKSIQFKKNFNRSTTFSPQ